MEQKNILYSPEDVLYFYESILGVVKIKQDTIFHIPCYEKNKIEYNIRKLIYQRDIHIYFFDHNFSYSFVRSYPVSYVQSHLFNAELKKLKDRKYIPEIGIDLHGLSQYHAQIKLSEGIILCHKKNISCFSVTHGHGKNILKFQVPIWLSKHPAVIAFYQVPNFFGHNTTLLVLIRHIMY
ncbi:endonuclease SmrB [Buchnera aphidicola]|uniref:Endonuclease SmrB n=1 Tax=Buchnera aphidicola (Stegophylla sp.) TaxID=2315800 RepID=A0A4D6Y9A1_9GAMM|nr:endonuclease SmrB [Buchnera aphidicola (Stegophylla sp.)]QCI26257.1 endonuclease SmrB [Buchnera aphidicola (Stegophylla sp.)]